MHSDEEVLPLDDEEASLPPIEFRSPGRFTISNPPSIGAAEAPAEAAPFQVGQPTALQRFELASQASAHTLAMLQQATRNLCLYSHDLDPWLYNNRAVQQACTRFLLASPKNRLRILLRDPGRVIRDGHLLLTLARKLSSNCDIRKLNPDYPAEEIAFLLTDVRALLVRPDPAQPAGYALYDDPARARQRLGQFEQAWDTSLSDADLRSMLL